MNRPHILTTFVVTTLAATLLVVSPVTVGNADDDGRTAARVARLVDQLSADTLQQRVDAQRQLQELGPAALPHLPNPRTLDASAADAVRQIRTLLERQQAQALLKPSRVTLRGTHTLADAIGAIQKQTGNPIDVAALPATVREQPLTLDFDGAAFWSAISSLEQRTDVVIRCDESSNKLKCTVRTIAKPVPASVDIVGPFRITVISAAVRPDFINPGRRILRITLNVETEPRLRPLFVHLADADIAVTDAAILGSGETPRTFPALSPAASREIPLDKPGPVRLTHDVILPRATPGDLLPSVKLRGSFDVEIATGQERFEFRHLREPGPVTRRHGGVSVTLADAMQDGNDLRAELRIAYDAGGPVFESHRAWVFHNDVRLSRPDAPPVRPVEHETLRESDSGVTLRYRFADASLTDDTTLTYTAPTLITRVPVTFAFDKVPLSTR